MLNSCLYVDILTWGSQGYPVIVYAELSGVDGLVLALAGAVQDAHYVVGGVAGRGGEEQGTLGRVVGVVVMVEVEIIVTCWEVVLELFLIILLVWELI